MPRTPWRSLVISRPPRLTESRQQRFASFHPRLEGLEDRTLLSALAGGPKPVGTGAVHQIVFVDSAVTDSGRFFQGVSAATDVVLLDNRSDPLQQISHTLAGQHGLDAVQIVSHGRPGALELGARWLDQTALNAAA